MKRKIALALLLAVLLVLTFSVVCFAEEVNEETTIIAEVEQWIEKVTSSTSIATLIASVLGFGGTGALLVYKLKDVLALLKKKADADTITKALNDSAKELTASFTAELATMKEKLNDEQERNKMLQGVLSIAFSYSKDIPASARAQIMSLLNSVDTKNATVQEIVEAAKEAIEEAEATTEKEETPALDEIVGNITMG